MASSSWEVPQSQLLIKDILEMKRQETGKIRTALSAQPIEESGHGHGGTCLLTNLCIGKAAPAKSQSAYRFSWNRHLAAVVIVELESHTTHPSCRSRQKVCRGF